MFFPNLFLVLPLFTVYQWNNDVCSATTGEYGNCMPPNDCVLRGGILGGPCAQGLGTCCVCMYFYIKQIFKLLEM